MTWPDDLYALSPPLKMRAWARGYVTASDAWRDCDRGNWLGWWMFRVAGDDPASAARRAALLPLCECVELARAFVPERRRDRVWPVIDRVFVAVRRWARGEDTLLADVQATIDALWDVEVGAGVACPPNAVWAVNAVINTAFVATNAAWAANTASNGVAWAVHAFSLSECAKIMRRHCQTAPVLPSGCARCTACDGGPLDPDAEKEIR